MILERARRGEPSPKRSAKDSCCNTGREQMSLLLSAMLTCSADPTTRRLRVPQITCLSPPAGGGRARLTAAITTVYSSAPERKAIFVKPAVSSALDEGWAGLEGRWQSDE